MRRESSIAGLAGILVTVQHQKGARSEGQVYFLAEKESGGAGLAFDSLSLVLTLNW